MKIVIEQNELLKSLKHVLGVIERRVTIPILGHVMIKASHEATVIIGTDTDIEVTAATTADVAESGSIAPHAQTLYDIVKELPAGSEIAMETKSGGRLAISCGKARFDLAILPAEEFPRMLGGEMTAQFDIASDDLKRMIDKTKMAMNDTESRSYLNGIFMHAQNNTLRAVATDGHRLARYEIPAPDGAEKFPGIIIPSKTVNEVRRIIDSGDAVVTISASERMIHFKAGAIELLSKQVDGTYPDYERIIPKRGKHHVTTLTSDLAKAINLVSIVMMGKTKAVKIVVAHNSMTLSGRDAERGTAEQEIIAEYSGEQIETGFNSDYARDMLQQISSKSLDTYIDDPASAILFGESEDPRALYIIMPLRV